MHHWDKSPRPDNSPGEEEPLDNLLGKRSSPPTDVTIHHQNSDEPAEPRAPDLTDQLDQIIKRARCVLEPDPRPAPAASVFELLARLEEEGGPEDLDRLLGGDSPAEAGAEGAGATLTARDADAAGALYKLLERQLVNLKWRPEGR